jgi:hypothetical protein
VTAQVAPVHDPDQGVVVGIGRVDCLKRIGALWRGDWSGHRFDGRDCQRWIETALYGSADDLRVLDEELHGLEENS